MLRKCPCQSLTDYVHFMRQTFHDYNKTCHLIDGSAAIHPHNLGLLMQRGISSTGPFGVSKQCVINAFDTDDLLSADEVMASILRLAKTWTRKSLLRACRPPTHDSLPSLRLSLLVAFRTAVMNNTHVPPVVVADYPTSAPHVAAWTTSCPPALPHMTPL
jgi:hypothetical protein